MCMTTSPWEPVLKTMSQSGNIPISAEMAGALGSVINRGSIPFTGADLPDIAKRFVFEHLGMNQNDAKLKDIPTLVKKVMTYEMPESPMTKLVECTKKHASNDADASEAM
jgi:hypothetical protein